MLPSFHFLPRAASLILGLSLSALLILSSFSATAQGDHELAHYWNFNNPGAPEAWPQPHPADFGSGTITYTFGGGVVNFGGSTVNARNGDGSGQSFVIQGGSGTANNGGSFQLNVATQGYQDLVFSYATRGTGTGFDSQIAEFSVDGGDTWTFIGEETDSRESEFFLVEYDLSGFPEVNDHANVIIRITLNGATSDTGNNRFDNITIDGVPSGNEGNGTGTGTATLTPNTVEGGASHNLTFTITGRSDTPTDELSTVQLTLPNGFGPVTSSDVSTNPAGGSVDVTGQTVLVSNLNVTESSPVDIILSSVSIPNDSGQFGFSVRTASEDDTPVTLPGQPSLLVYGAPITIAEASANDSQGNSLLLGEWVMIQGVVTTADEFATAGGELGPTYLEDETGGIAVFSPIHVSPNLEIGEEVMLFGKVTQFFGLNQLDDSTTIIESVSTGNDVVPEVVTLSDLANDGQGGVEEYEGRLVRVNGVTVNTTIWNVETGQTGTNYQLTDATGTLEVRINTNVDFVGDPAPSGEFDLIGVVSQFVPSAPYIGGYQILPRFGTDIITDKGMPVITGTAPFEQAATSTSITLEWTTSIPTHSEIRYNAAFEDDHGVIVDEEHKTEHSITLTSLLPATVYELEFRSGVDGDTASVAGYPVVTRAGAGTTHDIQVYFTGSVDHDYALHTPATSGSPLPRLLELIDNAEHSIDMALYSLSGSPGAAIATALIAAHNRGVTVRVIMDNSTSGTAPPTSLQNAGVPFITDAFGNMNDGSSLHHNKFAVIDRDGDSPDDVWVMTGSWNPTDPGTNQHNQNILFIQDGSVAAAYHVEFTQMWGSKSTTPNAALSRFGSNKQFLSPSVLWIGDRYTRLFFSPQGYGNYGRTEQQMIAALDASERDIYLGLNLITRIAFVNAMEARFNAGVDVRGVIGETGTSGSVFNELAAWADVHAHNQSEFGLIHHKYALVDPLNPTSATATITGSHNWSRSANEFNDENTLIIYDEDVTNQFLQEFVVRYYEAGGEGDFVVSIEGISETAGTFEVSPNYPNPFAHSTNFNYTLPESAEVTIRIYDVLGRVVTHVMDTYQPAGSYSVSLDASSLASGMYFYRVDAVTSSGTFSDTRRMTVVR